MTQSLIKQLLQLRLLHSPLEAHMVKLITEDKDDSY